MQEQNSGWFDRLFAKSAKTESPKQEEPQQQAEPKNSETKKPDWMYCKVPGKIRAMLKAVAKQICKGIDGASPTEDLHITLFHHLVNASKNRRRIETIAAMNPPCPAVLGSLRVFRTDKGTAVVFEVLSEPLKHMRWQMHSNVENVPSIHTYSPHITIAYLPAGHGIELEGTAIDDVTGQSWVIDDLFFTLNRSPRRVPIVGTGVGTHVAKREVATKACGMSTLSGESGGFIAIPGKKKRIEWLQKCVSVASGLEKEFGDGIGN